MIDNKLASKLKKTWQALNLDNSSSHAARLLRVAALRGILDTRHANILRLSANARDRQIKRLVAHKLLAELKGREKLRLGRGAPPATYRLTPSGVQICRVLGHPAHLYGQTNLHAQRHDLYLVDLALAARKNDLRFDLEAPIHYDRQGIVRPDALVHIKGTKDIPFEIEGSTDWHQRARLVDKVLNWLRFSQHSAASTLAADVRVLFLLNRAADLQDARHIWAEAITAVQAEYRSELGDTLPIRFWGQPILDFLRHPDWDGLNGFERLDNPALALNFGLAAQSQNQVQADEQADEQADPIAALIPPEALAGPSLAPADRVRLRAHTRIFHRYLQNAPRRFSPTFFDAVRDIYAAAFPGQDAGVPLADLLAIPWVALLTLRTWIHHYPELTRALQFAYKAYQSARYSGVSFSQQKATELVNAFLKFHGLRADGPLMRVWIARPGEIRQHSHFTVRVDVHIPTSMDRSSLVQDGWLLPPPSGQEHSEGSLWPDQDMSKLAARALQWVLQQLLDCPEVLEISPKPSKHRKKR